MKKIISIILALVLMLALFSACGKGETKAPSGTPSGSNGSASTPDESKGSEDEGSFSGTMKVGLLAPLTGSVAQYGVAVANGVRLYTKEINEKGGINGKKVELVEYDEEGDAAKAVLGYNSLVDQGVVAIVGDVTTGPTVAVVSESQADRMPMITASATALSVTYNEETGQVYENMFRSCFIDPFQGEKMASFAKEVLEAKTAAVLYNNGSDYSVGVAESFKAKANEIGLEIIADESYADGSIDFQGQLTNIAAKNPDVLFLPDYYEVIALIAQQANSAGVTATMLGVDGWDTVLEAVTDPALIEGAYYCSGYSTQDTREEVQTFLQAYKAEYGIEPNMFAAQGYDAAMILFDAIAKADADGKLDNETIISYMKATDMNCVTGHVTFDEYNNPNKTAVIINIASGEAKYWGNY
ncbi:MAG: ABC transporter substrate-binding protein [Oscillospiraceae bacterium]|jgi:branched-chain amino acid transport system substrate-binding protein